MKQPFLYGAAVLLLEVNAIALYTIAHSNHIAQGSTVGQRKSCARNRFSGLFISKMWYKKSRPYTEQLY
jgi:hypothetical protein